MVFCYKVITDTPSRSGAASPTRRSMQNVTSSLSQLIGSIDYEATTDVLDEIPEKDWRLLAVLAKKREEDDERELLADQFRNMWRKEKEEREMVEAESMQQYKRFVQQKRQQERTRLEQLQMQKQVEQQLRKGELIDCIRYKERRAMDQLAFIDDMKTAEIIDKSLEEKARAHLAADRRSRMFAAERCRRLLDLADAERRANDALLRKKAFLRDASQRVAITNALNSWGSTTLRQEAAALDAARRLAHALSADCTAARAARLNRARDARMRRARKMAAVTARLREAIRSPSRLQ